MVLMNSRERSVLSNFSSKILGNTYVEGRRFPTKMLPKPESMMFNAWSLKALPEWFSFLFDRNAFNRADLNTPDRLFIHKVHAGV